MRKDYIYKVYPCAIGKETTRYMVNYDDAMHHLQLECECPGLVYLEGMWVNHRDHQFERVYLLECTGYVCRILRGDVDISGICLR